MNSPLTTIQTNGALQWHVCHAARCALIFRPTSNPRIPSIYPSKLRANFHLQVMKASEVSPSESTLLAPASLCFDYLSTEHERSFKHGTELCIERYTPRRSRCPPPSNARVRPVCRMCVESFVAFCGGVPRVMP